MLLEDHRAFARLIKETFPEIRWHVVHDLPSACSVVDNESIDGFVVDLHLSSRPDGFQFIDEIAGAPALILTGDEDPRHVSEAHMRGVAIDYKSNWQAAVATFAERVRRGLRYRVRAFARERGLTARETEVLALLVDDYDRDEIADHLGISEWTARGHLRAVLKKSEFARLAAVRKHIRRS